MVSTSGLAIVLVFVVGVSIGLVFIKDRRSQMEQQMRVPMAKFGGLDTRHKEGPWPACLGMNGKDCLQLIASYDEHLQIQLIHDTVYDDDEPSSPDNHDFMPNRVRIFVNDSNLVTTIPNRG